MDGFQFKANGNWGHFKKRETGNNPLTHDFITKTALIGMIGAVLGFDRETMLPLFPQLSEDFLYGLKLEKNVKKNSWGFTSRKAFKPMNDGTPKYFEFLKDPSFIIIIGLKDNRSKAIFDEFKNSIKKEISVYTPVFGWHNCPANLSFLNEGEIQEEEHKDFSTKSFILKDKHQLIEISSNFRVGFENIPTYQSDFYNSDDGYREVIYPAANCELKVRGSCYKYSIFTENRSEKWAMI